MSKVHAKLSCVLALSALLAGCASTYVADANVPKLDEIPDIPAGARISLINAQPPAGKVEISQHGVGYTVYADVHAWTDQAIKGLKRTLQKKGVVVADGAPKSLKIALTKATLSSAGSGWSFRCTIVFTIDTGDGPPMTLGADDTSWKWKNACDGAMQKVMLATLNDERVRKFLASSKE
jgi:hypothetical protein